MEKPDKALWSLICTLKLSFVSYPAIIAKNSQPHLPESMSLEETPSLLGFRLILSFE